MGPPATDVCDLNRIYNPAPGYSYSLPRSVLESFLSGKSFDYAKKYTSDELVKLKADINGLFQTMMSANPCLYPQV